MATVIGITGLAGAGKDTYAAALGASLVLQGVASSISGFADPLREISKFVGLNPYHRATKESRVSLDSLRFQTNLSKAIRSCLPNMDGEDMRSLATYTLAACERFVDEDGDLNISPREFMQILGTEGGQRVRPTLWVDYQRDSWAHRAGIVLVPDFRFYHELPPLSAVLNVVRPGVGRVNAHVSEDLPDLLTRVVVPVIEGKPVTYVLNDRDLPHLQQTAALHAAMLLNDYKDSI